MKKQILAIAALLSAGLLAACNAGEAAKSWINTEVIAPTEANFKFGLITLHDSNSTYDKNFIDAFNAACTAKGVTAVVKSGVDESAAAKAAAVQLVEDGAKMVFADSFGHESHILEAATDHPEAQFFHATGTQAHTAYVGNFHNAFASIYEGRYLAGVAAGMKLKEMIAANPATSKKIGYVGAFKYAEVISGYTSFFLGVKSEVADVTMDVKFTESWYDETKEREAALALINGGCSLISQHADSWGAPGACEEKKVPNVSYNGSTVSQCPDTYLVSSKINWQPYFEHCIDQIKQGKPVDHDWVGTMANNSVQLTEFGSACAAGTAEKVAAVKAELAAGTRKVFDCSTFTVGGKNLTSYKADVDDMGDFVPETEVIKKEGNITYFAESEFRSAPYFDITIDGITDLGKVA